MLGETSLELFATLLELGQTRLELTRTPAGLRTNEPMKSMERSWNSTKVYKKTMQINGHQLKQLKTK